MRIINVACAIIEREGKFLLAKKSRDKKHPMKIEGEWHFPGGKAKNNEKIEDALLREIEEELGLKIRIEKLMSVITRKVNNECVLNFFWFFCRTSSTEVKKSKEIEEVTWVDKKEVLKYLREDLIRELPREVIELFS